MQSRASVYSPQLEEKRMTVQRPQGTMMMAEPRSLDCALNIVSCIPQPVFAHRP
jgi:hypothetical protein